MAYYLGFSSPETYESFLKSPMDITGFRIRKTGVAKKIERDDKFLC
jgi:hypothetical protein